MRELIARAIAANKMGLSNNGERLPDDYGGKRYPPQITFSPPSTPAGF